MQHSRHDGQAGGEGAEGGSDLVAAGDAPIQATERLPPLSIVRLEQSVDRLDRTARSLEDTAHRLLDARGSFWVQVIGWIFLLVFAPMVFLYGASHLPDVWRVKAAASLLGTTSLKGAAGHMLEMADERGLQRAEWGEELIAINRSRLRDCLAGTAAGDTLADGTATCNLIVPPPPRRSDLP
ncbi:MAG: hypothetical protein RIB84_26345 [Sneathiellaceae bacterium]